MNIRLNSLVVLGVFLAVASMVHAATARDSTSKAWTLAWSDEFNGSHLDTGKWVYDMGGGKWGNEELEYYTERPKNIAVKNGRLVITARREKVTGPDGHVWDYTSARIKTNGKFSQTYGRFEARIKIPYGQGIWPAFWMLGEDIEQAGWPNCGEIDVMENIGKEPATVHGTIHGPGYSGGEGIGSGYELPGRKHFSNDFHVYAVEWDKDAIRFYVDGNLYATRTPNEIPSGKKWAFDHPFFLLLNLAVGGDWPGNPDATTVFPQTMLVDYVRVYKKSGK